VREMLSPEHPTMFPEVFDLGASWLMQRDTIERLRAELREACEIAHLYRQLILLYNARMHLDRVDAFLARQEKP
jgi:hypothetical protein